MRFYLRWPTTAADCAYWSQQAETDGPDGVGGAIDTYTVRVDGLPGESSQDRFRRTLDRVLLYEIFPPRLMRPTVCSEDGRIREGAVIVQRVRAGLVVMEAAVRVVHLWHTESMNAEESGFTYATITGHPERSVSSFWVSRTGDVVEFGIKARSQPGTLLTRIGGQVSRAFQRAATRAALRYVASNPRSNLPGQSDARFG